MLQVVDIDMFVNSNAHNVELEPRADLDDVQREFEQRIGFDACDDEAFPVLVYTQEGRPVAWVDLENAVGYVAG